MMSLRAPAFWMFMLSALLVSCNAPIDGEGRYRIASVGNAQRAVEGRIISARPAYISTGNTGAGAALGGALGGAAASEASDNAGVIIAGIIGGMIVGDQIEGQNVHDATEYVVRTDLDALLTVAQINAGNPIFANGDRVILVYGYPSRLIPYPSQ